MKKIILLMFLFFNFLLAEEKTIDYFSMVFSEKFEKNVILDKEVYKELKVYGDKIDEKIDLAMIKQILQHHNFVVYDSNNYVYIATPKDEKKNKKGNYLNKKDKEIQKSIVMNIPLLPSKVLDVCDSLKVQCSHLSNYQYLVSYTSKSDISSLSAIKESKLDIDKRLKLTIVEVDFNKLKDHEVKIGAFFNAIINNSFINLNVLGSLDSVFKSEDSEVNNIHISTAFSFLRSNGFANVVKEEVLPVLDNSKEQSFHFGETVSVLDGTYQNTETNILEKRMKEINTGLTLSYTALIVNNNIYLDLKLDDLGSVKINADGTYSLSNKKSVNTSLVFNKSKRYYHIPFSIRTQIEYKDNNTLFEDVPFFNSIFKTEQITNSEKQVFIIFEYIDELKEEYLSIL